MRDIEHLKELFNYDELIHDFEFVELLYTSGITMPEDGLAIEKEIFWGDLV